MMSQLSSRDEWRSRRGFIFATVGAAVGLGNLWRFPFMAYENGGGAFLIPYLVAMLTAGVPLMIMEFGMGHKMRSGAPMTMAKVSKKWEWLGWWMVTIPLVVMVFYTVIVSWSINYLFFSFNKAWGDNPGAFFGGEFLAVSSGPFDFGGIQWPIFFSTIAIWCITYFVCKRGISKGIEAVCKVATPLLGVLFVIIVIRSVTLPGSIIGLNEFLNPNFSEILNAKVWVAAYSQVFFSATIAVGVMIAYASYLPKNSDMVNNGFITVFSNGTFDLLAGLAVFSVLGYIVNTTGVAFNDIAQSGAGIAFVAFPQAINLFPGGPVIQTIFGFLFFLSLMMAGITSLFSMMEAFISAVIGKFAVSREKLVLITSIIGFLVSIIFTTQAGVHILDIVDHFVGSYGIALIGLVEAIVLGYIYKASVVREHVNLTSDFKVGIWWDWCIKYITPVLLGYHFIRNLIDEIQTPYGGYPLNAIVILGWLLVGIMISVAVYLGFKDKNEYSRNVGRDNHVS